MADEDPFAAVVYTAGIEIDLTAPQSELAEKLRQLVQIEASLARRGVRCPLKDGGQDCSTCAEATLESAQKRSRLCRVGKDQATVWAAGEARQREHMGPILALAAQAAEMSEIGHLSGEYVELLTAAGL